MSTAARALKRVKDIRFLTEENAKRALLNMRDFIQNYGCVTLSDVYFIAEVYVPDFRVDAVSIDKIGWIKLDESEAFVYMENDDWLLGLPVPHILGSESRTDSKPKPEAVNHPSHYQSETGLEAIDVIEAFTFDLKGIEAFCTGNALKYLCRWKGKNGKTDLEKARWYINRLIEHIEKLEKENE